MKGFLISQPVHERPWRCEQTADVGNRARSRPRVSTKMTVFSLGIRRFDFNLVTANTRLIMEILNNGPPSTPLRSPPPPPPQSTSPCKRHHLSDDFYSVKNVAQAAAHLKRQRCRSSRGEGKKKKRTPLPFVCSNNFHNNTQLNGLRFENITRLSGRCGASCLSPTAPHYSAPLQQITQM